MPAWSIRPPGPEDVDELARVHVAIWREAYAGLLPESVLAAQSVEQRAEMWRRTTTDPGEVLTRVAVDAAGRLLGFASAGPTRDDDAPVPWELWALYLLADARGAGVAEHLCAAVVGDRDTSLWVFEDNVRARGFYEKVGFVADGTRQEWGASRTPEIRMVRDADLNLWVP